MTATVWDTYRDLRADGWTAQEAAERVSERMGRTHPSNVRELRERMERIEREHEETPTDTSTSTGKAA